MIKNCMTTVTEEEWKQLPLQTLLYEWARRNLTTPSDMSTVLSYVGLFLIAWYTIIWITRLVLALIRPIFLVVSAIVVLRILQYYEPDEIRAIMINTYNIISNTIVRR
ncbi:hypothetical protein GQX74_004048 [Glossina fuscipes]|nr:hypothetical protein GQX74_004048 [Glossina fuscipes]